MKKLSKYYEDMVLSPEPNAFCMLKPGFNQYKDEFERLLKLNGWKIIKHCSKQFTRPEIEDFYIMHKDQGFYHKLCDYMITEACECYSCYKRCKDPYKEMGDFKKKIRDEWGEDEMRNGMHSSDNKENMLKECNIAFNTVNEKLKVNTASISFFTYQQFADMLQKYCEEMNTIGLAPGRINSNYTVEELPPFLLDEGYITLIRPHYDLVHDCNQLAFAYIEKNNSEKKYWDLTLDKNVLERLVDFTTEEWVEKLCNYMKDLVKYKYMQDVINSK